MANKLDLNELEKVSGGRVDGVKLLPDHGPLIPVKEVEKYKDKKVWVVSIYSPQQYAYGTVENSVDYLSDEPMKRVHRIKIEYSVDNFFAHVGITETYDGDKVKVYEFTGFGTN